MELTEKEQLLLTKFAVYVETKGLSNEGLVQFIELAGSYLNLKTIPDYAKENKRDKKDI